MLPKWMHAFRKRGWAILVVVALTLVLSILCFFPRNVPDEALTRTRMRIVQRRILDYYSTHGKLPSTLSSLRPESGHVDGEVADAWGAGIGYRVVGTQVILESLGRDGKPGGVGENQDIGLLFSAPGSGMLEPFLTTLPADMNGNSKLVAPAYQPTPAPTARRAGDCRSRCFGAVCTPRLRRYATPSARVWLVDGTRCSMPDTPSLQRAFGQPDGQQLGCGFPVALLTGLFCWAGGALLDVAIGSYRDSELQLWRRLWRWLRAGDVVVGDRFYCTYADLAGLVRRGCEAVCRLHQRRKVDWRKARHARGHSVTVKRWRRLPRTLDVRLIRGAVGAPGFRTRKLIIATTLLNPVAYPAADILALYGDRWTVELRLRDIKITPGMDILRGKSPSMVRKEKEKL